MFQKYRRVWMSSCAGVYDSVVTSIARSWKLFLGMSTSRKAILVVFLATIVLVSRSIDTFLNYQFWAEDGQFYADAYTDGISTLLAPYAGILQTVFRCVALLSTYTPMNMAPLVYSIASLFFMVLPVFILWSDPDILFGKKKQHLTLLLTFLYVLMPALGEVYGNAANIGWFLSISAALVLTRRPKTRKKWLWFDILLLMACGLTGPYALLLLPAALYVYLFDRRSKEKLIKLFVVLVCAFIQLSFLSQYSTTTDSGLKQQAPELINNYQIPIKITGMRFFVLPTLGDNAVVKDDIADSGQVLLLGFVIIFMAMVAYKSTSRENKPIAIFGLFSYASIFFRPQSGLLLDFWTIMHISSLASRYYVAATFVWIVSLIWLYDSRGRLHKIAGTVLVIFSLSFPVSFFLEQKNDTMFTDQVTQFKLIDSGEEFCFVSNPEGWGSCVIKRQ